MRLWSFRRRVRHFDPSSSSNSSSNNASSSAMSDSQQQQQQQRKPIRAVRRGGPALPPERVKAEYAARAAATAAANGNQGGGGGGAGGSSGSSNDGGSGDQGGSSSSSSSHATSSDGSAGDSSSSGSGSSGDPSREAIDSARKKAESMCDLPHIEGAGCIKCNGLVSALLSGRASESSLAQTEFPTVGVSKNIEPDRSGHVQQCNACAAGIAQHPVLEGLHQGATGPDAKPDPQQLCTCPEKEAKAREFYGTQWAGKTAPDGTQVPELAVCEGPFEQPQMPVPSHQ